MTELHKVIFYPVGNGDTEQLILDNGRRVLFDFCHRSKSEDESTPEIDLKKRLKEELKEAKRDYFDVVAFTHADNDHIQGSTEFFWLQHAKKYQNDERIKIRELWVPAAMLLETADNDQQSDEFVLLRQEARFRLLEGKDIRVFSKPPALRDWLEAALKERNLPANARDHLFVNAGTDGNRFAVLVELPIVRDLGGIVERVQRIAFLLLAGKLDLGLRVGAYIKHEGTVYRFQEIPGGNAMQELDWQSLPIMPVAVLDAAEPARLREYSGIKGDGPAAGVLVGAGALGSALVDLWSRGGWGSWTVVDSDHIKPHNLARHRAYDGFVGESKATFARVISETIAPPGVVRQALTCDACDTKNDQLTKAFGAADFVLDCSTTLDFPRLASTATTKARHASAFLTPSGRDCVLLMEDTQRKLRLNTLEAQYYRALISRPWGNDHLKGNLSTFWSGASCRDVSVKLEYASILAHAAIINQQVRALLESEEACVRIWARDPATGRVDTHRVPVYKPVEHHSQAVTLRYDEGLVRRLRAMRQQYLPKETGGVVVGYFDLNLRELVLVDCFPPPLDSTHSTTHFVRGVRGVLESVTQAQKRTAGVVGYVGEWHSHPPGHSALPSRDDFIQLHKLSNDMAQDGLPILQVIVGEHDISLQVLGEVLR